MSGPRHWPLIAWSRRELLGELWEHQQAVRNLTAELERRGERDDERHGFSVPIYDRPGVISTAYRHFSTPAEAYDAARKHAEETGGDIESAPYRVHPVYLGKDDPA